MKNLLLSFQNCQNMEPPEEYGFDFDQVEENFEDFMEDEEAMVSFFVNLCVLICFHLAKLGSISLMILDPSLYRSDLNFTNVTWYLR